RDCVRNPDGRLRPHDGNLLVPSSILTRGPDGRASPGSRAFWPITTAQGRHRYERLQPRQVVPAVVPYPPALASPGERVMIGHRWARTRSRSDCLGHGGQRVPLATSALGRRGLAPTHWSGESLGELGVCVATR